MGNYVNPGNSGFSGIRNDLYVDKTGLIRLINQTIDTPRRLTCVSRPRRFGKTFAAKMLCAYYDKTCNSAELFHDLDIADDTQYCEHLNRYDVIYLDMTGIIGESSITEVIPYIQRAVKGYGSDILLVGISYDREALPGERKHQCRIERYEGKT